MSKKSKRIIILLLMLLLIPFSVEAKSYKVVITFFSAGGEVNTGNIEVINNVVFEKDSYAADVKYKPTDTIKNLNSLDKKTTFTLKKNGTAQAQNQEWYGGKQTDDSPVYFSNSKSYKVKDLIKKLEMNTSYSSKTGEPLEIFLYANYSNVDAKADTKKDTKKETKTVAVKSVKLSDSSKKMNAGETYTLKATISPSDATNKDVTWNSSNTKVVAVDSNGKINAKSKGKATITVKTKDGNKKASMTVEVTDKKTYYVNIRYSANGGIMAYPHPQEFTINNSIMYRNGSILITKLAYNEKTSNTGLADYNNSNFINLNKKDYIVKANEEWNTKPDGSGKSYSQYKVYKASDFCNASSGDCTITLYANWKRAKTTTINLATFNIGFFNCGGSDFDCSPTTKDFSNLIKNNNIDIIGLQEARTTDYFKSKSNKKKSNSIIKTIGDNAGLSYEYIIAPKNVNAILSKYKLRSKKTISLPSCEDGGKTVEAREIQKTIINVNGVDISYYNTHLDYHGECAKLHMMSLANTVKNDKNPVIITADYNRVQIDNYEQYLKPLGFEIAANDTKYKGTDGSNSYMDSVFILSKNHIDIKSAKTILAYKKYSDHNLVIATLSIK